MRHFVIGPRGGILTADVSCYTCLCVTTCHNTKHKDLGCADWVNTDGQRVYFPKDFDLETNPDGKVVDCEPCGKCADLPDLPDDLPKEDVDVAKQV